MFQFKQFSIEQSHAAMKVGTDAVLLGAWAGVEGATRILDMGTGTGVIALILAQRQPKASIDAIEIEENAFQQACENVGKSRWSNRISVFHTSLQNFNPNRKYDLIVSNPPFFSQSLKNPDTKKTLARHNDSLTPAEIAQHAQRILSEKGRVAVIYPIQEAQAFLREAQEIGLHPLRITRVIPSLGKEAKRMLVELSAAASNVSEGEICIEKETRHSYTQEYIDLTKDFYLNF